MKVTLTPKKSDLEWIRKFADALGVLPQHFTAGERDKIANIIRRKIEDNFDRESAGGIDWAELAVRTGMERYELGFDPFHPILERTGEYRMSWTQADHPSHLDEWTHSGDVTTLEIGSLDYRAERLSLGDPLNALPPRPAADLSEDALLDVVERAEWVIDSAALRLWGQK